jgi:hypothetical protein
MPVKVKGHNLRLLLLKITKDRKTRVDHPFQAEMDNLRGDILRMKKIGQSEKPEGKQVYGKKMMEWPVIVF